MGDLVRRYGRWQLRDYFVERGMWTMLVGLAALAIFWLNYDTEPPRYLTSTAVPTGQVTDATMPPIEAGGAARVRRRPPAPTREERLAEWKRQEPKEFRQGVIVLFTMVGFAGTLLATHGIVSRDRERGYHRFLFAKPVSMVGYYAQAFAASGLGLLAVSAALLGATALAFHRAVPVAALGVVGAEFALLGGTVFLLSALWRFDGVIAALTWPLAALVSALAREGAPSILAQLAEPILPPVREFGVLMAALDSSTRAGAGDALPATIIVLGYGAVAFVAGLCVIRRRAAAS